MERFFFFENLDDLSEFENLGNLSANYRSHDEKLNMVEGATISAAESMHANICKAGKISGPKTKVDAYGSHDRVRSSCRSIVRFSREKKKIKKKKLRKEKKEEQHFFPSFFSFFLFFFCLSLSLPIYLFISRFLAWERERTMCCLFARRRGTLWSRLSYWLLGSCCLAPRFHAGEFHANPPACNFLGQCVKGCCE